MEYKLLALALLISAVRVQGISFGTTYTEHVRYLVAVVDRNNFCSGIVLNDKAILTAAHCAQNISQAEILFVNKGTGGIDVLYEGEIIKNVVVHPDYNSDTKENDLAVIALWQSLYVESTFIPLTTEIKDNTTCIVSGFGAEASGDSRDEYPIFKEVEMTACDGQPSGHICAEAQINSTLRAGVLCRGDAGAPLVCNNELVGIAVSDDTCGTSGPDVYQSVVGLESWIAESLAIEIETTTSTSTSTSTPASTSTTTKIPTSTLTSTSTKDSGSASTSVLNPFIMIAIISVILKMTLTQVSI